MFNATIFEMKKGVVIFFTGLSGSGKTTLALALQVQLGERAQLLDGDAIRKQVVLGFSKEDRDIQVKRVGELAADICKTGDIVICALIAPYESTRNWVRNLVNQHGNFFEIYVSTPLEICEKRDPKGLYKKARNLEILNFTGVSDPYEIPSAPDLVIDTHEQTVDESIAQIIHKLQQLNYI